MTKRMVKVISTKGLEMGSLEASGILLSKLFSADPEMVIVSSRHSNRNIETGVNQILKYCKENGYNPISTSKTWMWKENEVAILCSKSLSWDSTVDVSRGLSTISHGDYQEVSMTVEIRVIESNGTDGCAIYNQAVENKLKELGIGRWPKVLATSADLSANDILRNNYSAFKGMLFGTKDDGLNVPVIYVPEDVVKLNKRKAGEVFTADVYVVEDAPAAELYNVKLSAQQYRGWGSMTVKGREIYSNIFQAALTNAYESIGCLDSLRKCYSELKLDDEGLFEENEKLKGSVKELVSGMPMSHVDIKDLSYYAFKTQMSQTRIGGFKLRAYANPEVNYGEVTLPLNLCQKLNLEIGSNVTLFRSPYSGTEGYTVTVTGYSHTPFVNHQMMKDVFSGDEDGDWLYGLKHQIFVNRKVDERVEWRKSIRKTYKKSTNNRTIADAFFFQIFSKRSVGIWDRALTSAWLNKDTEVLASVINGYQDTIDCEKHAEIPFPGVPGKELLGYVPAEIDIYGVNFSDIDELNELAYEVSKSSKIRNILKVVKIKETWAQFDYASSRKARVLINPLTTKGYLTTEQKEAAMQVISMYKDAISIFKTTDISSDRKLEVYREKMEITEAAVADDKIRTTLKYLVVLGMADIKSTKILGKLCSVSELTQLSSNMSAYGQWSLSDPVSLEQLQ